MRTKPGLRRNAPLLLCCLLFAAPLAAEVPCPDGDDPACKTGSGWTMCRVPLASPVARPSPEARLRAEMLIEAGRAEYVAGTRAELEDGFEMSRLDQHLSASRGSYDRSSGTFRASGDVYYREAGVALTGSEFELQLDSNAGRLERARYALVEQHARGQAARAAWDGSGYAALDRATYTTCDPGDGSWLLSAARIELDFDAGLGKAEDAVLRVADVPILYTPWVQFPIDDRRRSGLLMPSFGNSSDSGFDLSIPYYWNIAPNRDATFTPRVMGKRGFQLGAQYRYLYRSDDADPEATQTGEVELEVLPADDVFGDDRLGLQLLHVGRPADGWLVGVDAGYVSDRDYLRDLGGDLEDSNANFVDRRAFVSFTRDDWSLLGQATYLQSLLADVHPYQALPQLLLDYTPFRGDLLQYGLESELVHYDRTTEADGTPAVTGTRLDLQPWIGVRAERSWGFIEPRLTLHHTRYLLEDQFASDDRRPSRTLPVSRLDAGLFLDRPAFGGRFRQTLEPRLYYLHVPHERQSTLLRNAAGDSVVFDSARPLFGWQALFRDNRFSGNDRIGDANRLTLAVTSRLLDDRTGAQRARLDLGQILHFRDREVVLPGQAPETQSSSPFVARVSAWPGHGIQAAGELIWDPHDEETDVGTFSLSYRPDLVRLIRFAYRDNGDDIEQADLGISWPLSAGWHAVGRWLYSIEAQTSLETFAGFEYKSCCWAARLVLREFVRDTLQPDAKDFAVMAQLELSGLGRLGDDVTGFLSASLPGYTEARP